jgi:hypothetical protein
MGALATAREFREIDPPRKIPGNARLARVLLQGSGSRQLA